MKQPNDNLKTWLIDNSWNLIVTVVAIIVAFTYLKVEVISNTDKIGALENKVATYPSEDYFTLKFKTIDDNINTANSNVNAANESIKALTNKIDEHIKESK